MIRYQDSPTIVCSADVPFPKTTLLARSMTQTQEDNPSPFVPFEECTSVLFRRQETLEMHRCTLQDYQVYQDMVDEIETKFPFVKYIGHRRSSSSILPPSDSKVF